MNVLIHGYFYLCALIQTLDKYQTLRKHISYSGNCFQVAFFGFKVDDGPVDRVQVFSFDSDPRATTDPRWRDKYTQK